MTVLATLFVAGAALFVALLGSVLVAPSSRPEHPSWNGWES